VTLGRRTRETWRKARKLVVLSRTPLFRLGVRSGVAAAIEHQEVAFRHEAASVIDVGASRGQFALFATHRFPGAHLFCFEPIPHERERLQQVLREHPAAQVFETAVSDESGSAVLHLAEKSDSSSLLLSTKRQTAEFPGSREVAAVPVPTIRLDEALSASRLRSPCLLKVDVQGLELSVLQGAQGILATVHEVLIECSFVELYRGQALVNDVVRFLSDQGFLLAGVSSIVRSSEGYALQGDFHFVRQSP
jgi:FkbM family methyltransferase